MSNCSAATAVAGVSRALTSTLALRVPTLNTGSGPSRDRHPDCGPGAAIRPATVPGRLAGDTPKSWPPSVEVIVNPAAPDCLRAHNRVNDPSAAAVDARVSYSTPLLFGQGSSSSVQWLPPSVLTYRVDRA